MGAATSHGNTDPHPALRAGLSLARERRFFVASLGTDGSFLRAHSTEQTPVRPLGGGQVRVRWGLNDRTAMHRVAPTCCACVRVRCTSEHRKHLAAPVVGAVREPPLQRAMSPRHSRWYCLGPRPSRPHSLPHPTGDAPHRVAPTKRHAALVDKNHDTVRLQGTRFGPIPNKVRSPAHWRRELIAWATLGLPTRQAHLGPSGDVRTRFDARFRCSRPDTACRRQP